MTAVQWAWLLLLPGLTAWLTHRFIRWSRRRAWLDLPGRRRSHHMPTPSGAGLVFISLWLLSLPLFPLPAGGSWLIGLGAGMLMLTGWLDDRLELSILTRLLIQTLAAALLLSILWHPPAGQPGVEVGLGWLLLLWLAVVWYVNAFNFMDGIDGMAVQQGLSTLGFLAGLGAWLQQPALFWPAAALVAVQLGFLPFNRHPARVFMGDAGSLPLGYLSVALALLAWWQGWMNAPAVWMLLALFNLDALFTLVKRGFSNKRCYTPHREHLYQWMVRAGYSHAQVTRVYGMTNLLVIWPLTAWANALEPWWAWGVVMAVSVVLAWLWWWLRIGLVRRVRTAGARRR